MPRGERREQNNLCRNDWPLCYGFRCGGGECSFGMCLKKSSCPSHFRFIVWRFICYAGGCLSSVSLRENLQCNWGAGHGFSMGTYFDVDFCVGSCTLYWDFFFLLLVFLIGFTA